MHDTISDTGATSVFFSGKASNNRDSGTSEVQKKYNHDKNSKGFFKKINIS